MNQSINQIMTRLPAPESEFQASRPCATSFLSEVLAGTEQMEMSHFAESIAMIAMYGRALCHRQQSAVEQLYGDALQDFWSRHHWLDSILTNRIQVLSKKAKCPSNNNDPMLLFTSIVAHATVLSLCKAIKAVPWHTDEYKILILNYEQRCLSAAQDIVTLARESQHNTFFYVSYTISTWLYRLTVFSRSTPSRRYRCASVPTFSKRTETSTPA